MNKNSLTTHHKRHVDVAGKKVDLILFSYLNLEQLVIPFLFPKNERETFDHFGLSCDPFIKSFFDIYFSTIHQSFLDNKLSYMGEWRLYPVVWKSEDIDFFSFHDCLLNHLLCHFLKKKKKGQKIKYGSQTYAKLKLGGMDLLSAPENEDSLKKFREHISKTITDKKISSFASKLLNNLIEFKIYNFGDPFWPYSFREKRIQSNVLELFNLLKENYEYLTSYLADSGLEKYFPVSADPKREEGACDKVFAYVLRFKKISNFIIDFVENNIFRNQYVGMFAVERNVFYKIIGLGSDSFFNQKSYLILPNTPTHEISEKSYLLLNPRFQNLTILDHNTKQNEVLRGARPIFFDAQNLLTALSAKFIRDKKHLEKINNAKNLEETVEAIVDGFSCLKKRPTSMTEFSDSFKEEIRANPEKKTLRKAAIKTRPTRETAFTKMFNSVMPLHNSADKLCTYLFSIAEQSDDSDDKKGFKDKHGFVEFEIITEKRVPKIRWESYNSKKGDTMSRATLIKKWRYSAS